MAKMSRDKGIRIEREIIALHQEIGIYCERVPLSGAAHYKGGVDVDIYTYGKEAAPMVAEVKARASGEGFKLLEKWLGDAELLFLRRDRAEPLVVLAWSTYSGLLDRIRR